MSAALMWYPDRMRGWLPLLRLLSAWLQVMWQLSLGKGERLVLVRLHERCLLLGVSGGGINVLTELTREEAAQWLQKEGEVQRAPSFMEILKENLPKKK